MDDGIQRGINDQIRAELEAAYLYLAKSAHFTAENYDGFARWMRLQAEEELAHAMRLHGYLLERGGRPELEAVLEHARQVTAMIHDLYALARDKRDYATELHLQWFISEQVEEEANAERAVQQLRRAGDESSAILLLDHQFGQRAGS